MTRRSLSLLVHGLPKVGKTHLAASAPAPRLILDAEGGSRFLRHATTEWDPTKGPPPEHDGTWETCVVWVRDYPTLEMAYQWLQSGQHPFKSVVLDSLSEAQQRCVDAIAGNNPMQLQNWGTLFRTVAKHARDLRDLLTHPTKPLDAVIVVCMSRDSGATKQPYVQGQLSITLPYYFDVVGYLFTAPNEEGALVRRLLVAPAPGFEAGDRTGRLGSYVESPTIGAMLDTIYGPEEAA